MKRSLFVILAACLLFAGGNQLFGFLTPTLSPGCSVCTFPDELVVSASGLEHNHTYDLEWFSDDGIGCPCHGEKKEKADHSGQFTESYTTAFYPYPGTWIWVLRYKNSVVATTSMLIQ